MGRWFTVKSSDKSERKLVSPVAVLPGGFFSPPPPPTPGNGREQERGPPWGPRHERGPLRPGGWKEPILLQTLRHTPRHPLLYSRWAPFYLPSLCCLEILGTRWISEIL